MSHIFVSRGHLAKGINKDVHPVYEKKCLPHKVVAAGWRNSHRYSQNWKTMTGQAGHPVGIVTGVALS